MKDVKRRLIAGPLALVGLLCAVYLGDYAVIRYRVATKRGGLGTVTVYHYYAIQEKANKVQYVFNGSEDQTCVHALFPHMSYPPCWWVERHKEKRSDI